MNKFENTGAILRLQFAERGEWENALITVCGDVSSTNRFREWISNIGAEFAVEVFGSISAPADCFMGIRFLMEW